MTKIVDYGELEKYFSLLKSGNIVAARLHNGQIDFPTAKILFGKYIEEFARKIEEEKSSKQ